MCISSVNCFLNILHGMYNGGFGDAQNRRCCNIDFSLNSHIVIRGTEVEEDVKLVQKIYRKSVNSNCVPALN